MDDDPRLMKVRRNIVFSSLFRGLGMVIGLWMVPLTLHYLNPTKYGIWLTMTSIIAWFNFFDVGLGNGLRNKLGEALAKGELSKAKSYVSTTYALLSIIVVIIFLGYLLVSRFIDWSVILNVPNNFDEDLGLLMLIVFFFFCFRFVFGLILTILNADHKIALAGFIDLLTNIFSFVGVYLVTLSVKESLLWLGTLLSLVPAFVLTVASFWLLSSKYRSISPGWKYVNFSIVKNLTQLSFQFFLLQIIVLVIFFSNNIIISQLLSPAKVAEFNIVHKYFSIITIASVLVLNPFWSAANEAYHKQDFEWLRKTPGRLIKIWGLTSLVTLFMAFASPFVYDVWIKGEIDISMSSSVLMGLYVIILSWHNSFVYLINGIGKIRLQLYIYVVMGALAIPLAFLFIKTLGMGINGSILSMIVCTLPAAILIPIQFNLIVKGKAVGVFNS